MAQSLRSGPGGRSAEEGGPPIEDYALIGDRRTAALVSSGGSIDWCCLPRFDSGSIFGRLLDRDRGGHCTLCVEGGGGEHRYLEETMVLETRWRTEGSEARVLDFFACPDGTAPPRIVRIAEGVKGSLRLQLRVEPRFDYGAVAPWVRGADGVFAAIGGDDGLLIRSDAGLEPDGRHALGTEIDLAEGERRHLEIAFRRPIELESLDGVDPIDPEELDECREQAVSWWRDLIACVDRDAAAGIPGILRSALTLKALTYEPSGAIVAAPTTSLPETRRGGGERNWDYRFSWVRDSALAVRSLAALGCDEDPDAVRRFVERSAAGSAAELQIVFGVGGERRLDELEVRELEGWRGAAPVRIGNEAARQRQLDAFGQLVDQSWRWHLRGNSPDDEYWHFVADLVDAAVDQWRRPDRGIWEWRGEPRHFVHSKALVWSALDRGIRLAEDCGKDAPDSWRATRDDVRATVEEHGYDEQRKTFLMDFDHDNLDAALLRLPAVGFLDWRDERMEGTVAAIREALDFDGLLRRHDADDGLPEEGAFLACSFWLATCLARQGRREDAREVFDRAASTANDLGLFAEEFDPEAGRTLGNFPQALTHLSHIEAGLALLGWAE